MTVDPEQILPTSESPREIVIEARSHWWKVDWPEIWRFRDLLAILVHRDFLARYKQTLLGPAWFILQPLLTAMVMSLAFHRFAGVPTNGIPPLLFSLCGLLAWSYFAQNITTGAATFTANAHLFSKVYFPRLVVPLAGILSNLFALALQLLVFLLFTLFYALQGWTFAWTWQILSLPLLFLLTAVLSFGVSLLFAASTAKYRDLSHLTPVLLQLWMFLSPVFYPLEQIIRNESWAWLAWINPMAPIVEASRAILLGTRWLPELSAMLVLAAFTSLLALGAGLLAFTRVEKSVVDTV